MKCKRCNKREQVINDYCLRCWDKVKPITRHVCYLRKDTKKYSDCDYVLICREEIVRD